MMKKFIAPIAICILFVCYYAGIAFFGVLTPLAPWEKLLLICGPLALAGGHTIRESSEQRFKRQYAAP